MTRNIISPDAISTFCTIIACTTLMMCTGLNMAPAIGLNLVYCAFGDSLFGQQLRRAAQNIFDVAPWKRVRFTFAVSATLTAYATFFTAMLQFANRILFVLLTLSRSRTIEQNVSALASQWNSFSFLFVSYLFAEKFCAVVVFICVMWILYLVTSLFVNDLTVSNAEKAQNILSCARQPLQFVQAPGQELPEATAQQISALQQMLQQKKINQQQVVEKELRDAYRARAMEQLQAQREKVQVADEKFANEILPELLRAIMLLDKQEKQEQQQEQDENQQKEQNAEEKKCNVEEQKKEEQGEDENQSVAKQLPNGFMAECNCAQDDCAAVENMIADCVATVEDANDSDSD